MVVVGEAGEAGWVWVLAAEEDEGSEWTDRGEVRESKEGRSLQVRREREREKMWGEENPYSALLLMSTLMDRSDVMDGADDCVGEGVGDLEGDLDVVGDGDVECVGEGDGEGVEGGEGDGETSRGGSEEDEEGPNG